MEQNVNLDNQVTDIKMEIKSEPDDIPVPYEDVVPKLANEETILFDQNGSGFEIKKEWETEYEVEKIVMEQVICFDNKDDVKCKIESITKELGLKSEERVVTSNEDPINTSCKNCVFKTEKKDSVAGPLSHEDEQVCSPSCVCAKCSITDMRLPCQCKESLSVDRSFLRSEKQPHERRQASTSEEEPDALTRSSKPNAQLCKEYREHTKLTESKTPACQTSSSTVKSNAQRCKEYRERKKLSESYSSAKQTSSSKDRKTNAQRCKEYRERKKLDATASQASTTCKTSAQRSKEYRARLKSGIQIKKSKSKNHDKILMFKSNNWTYYTYTFP